MDAGRPKADADTVVLERLRLWVLGVIALGLIGTMTELILLEHDESGLEVLDLRLLILDLLREVLGHGLVGHGAFQSRAGKGLVFLVHGHLGPLQPLLLGFLVFLELLLEDVLVGNGDGDLRFHLEQLVLHVQGDLLDHLFRVFGLVDEVVEVGPN